MARSATCRSQVGDLVAPGKRLLAVVPLAEVYVEANFKETQIAELTPGTRSSSQFDAFPDRELDRHGGGRRAGLGVAVQPAAAGERHRQLHQDRAARPRPDRGARRRRRRGLAPARPVGRRLGRHPHCRPQPDARRSPPRQRWARHGSEPEITAAPADRVSSRWSSACSWRSSTSRSSRRRLSEIQAGLSASADEISWVQTSYLIAEVIMIPLSGFLAPGALDAGAVHHLRRRLHAGERRSARRRPRSSR